MTVLVHELISASAHREPDAPALVHRARCLSYLELATMVATASDVFLEHGLKRGQRVAVYLDKRPETVAAMFGASAAGGVFVPVNPLLKAAQVAHIIDDCTVTILVTSAERLAALAGALAHCASLRLILLVGTGIGAGRDGGEGSESNPRGQGDAMRADETLRAGDGRSDRADSPASGFLQGAPVLDWTRACSSAPAIMPHRVIDTDVAAILYTSGSTGRPKGVVLSHRNLVAGATSVAGYLENTSDDRILAVLPLSFDYGLSQLTTAFHVGATAVLMDHLLPRDIIRTVQAERITGLAAVPPLWLQIADLPWPDNCTLRYVTNSGGRLPRATLDRLRAALPEARVYLMYGLTEAFRSTYLAPEELDRRPDSIGKAIPNADILVLRPDGTQCEPGEAGELVHRGALVSLGYWNDVHRTAERFRPLPPRDEGLPFPELAVWSGDTVRADTEGFLYFISRDDDMIKSSGFRISPTEVEEIFYADRRVAEAAVFGVPHPTLGQAIVVVASLHGANVDVDRSDDAGDDDGARKSDRPVRDPVKAAGAGMGGKRSDVHPDAQADALTRMCRQQLPGYMVPARIIIHDGGLPRTPNGKIDRNLLRTGVQDIFRKTNDA